LNIEGNEPADTVPVAVPGVEVEIIEPSED
jgi:hypothetical protein